MPLFDWIRSDLHSLNLDWIISKIKTVEESEQGAVDAAADANASKTAAAASKTAAAASATAASGSATLAAVSAQQAQNLVDQLDTTIAQDVSDWLDEHITPTTPAVDDTLTVSGAAADAAVTGDKITELKTAVNQTTDIIIGAVSAFDSTEAGIVYNTSNPSGASWSGGHSFVKAVNAGEMYAITTTIPASPSRAYYAVLLYNNSTLVSGVYQGGTSGNDIRLTDYIFSIPNGVNKIIVSTYSNVTAVLKTAVYESKAFKLANNFVSFDGTTLNIKGRYNKDEDIVIRMKKRGNNNLFDFDKVYTVPKTDILDGNFDVGRNILSVNTDCFSPHQIYAVNNPEGDGGSYFLTGGNHDRNGVPTAYCDDLKVFIDGSEKTNFNGLCNHVRVKWTNHIQGWNTFKMAGNGRTILTEKITLDIERLTFKAFVEQIPTEDLYQSVYYGLMSINTPYPKLRFIGGSNRAENATNTAQNSGDLNCRRTIAYNESTGDVLETHIEDEDLGTFDLTGQLYSAFTGNNKLYYAIIEPTSRRMNAGQLFTLSGYYKFYSGI